MDLRRTRLVGNLGWHGFAMGGQKGNSSELKNCMTVGVSRSETLLSILPMVCVRGVADDDPDQDIAASDGDRCSYDT